MAGKDRGTRKKGFSFVSMLIGILIGIVVLAAAVGGVVAYFLFADIDDVLGWVGLENEEEDENGDTRYVYVNGDEISNLWGIISWATSVEDYSEMTLGELGETFPVVSTFTEELCDSLSEYIELDPEEVEAVKFNELSDWLVDKIEEINIASVMNIFDMNMDDPIMEALFYGPEASYATWEDADYPVWYDEYEYLEDEESFVRISDGETLDEGFEGYIYVACGEDENGEEIVSYRIYYAAIDGAEYVVTTEDEYSYEFAKKDGELVPYAAGEDGRLTGNFYWGRYENDEGEQEYGRIVVTYITLGDLMDDPMSGVYGLYITDLLDSEPGDMIYDLFEGMTLGDLMDGSTDFEAIINDLELSMFMEVSLPSDSAAIMMYIIYGVSDLEEAYGQSYSYTGVYSLITENGTEYRNCYIVTANGKVTGVYLDADFAEEAGGTKISEVEARMDGMMNDLKIGEIVNLGDSSLMSLISESTINSLGNDIAKLTLNQFMAEDIYGSSDLKEAVPAGQTGIDENTQINFDESYVYYMNCSGILTLAGWDGAELVEGNGKLTETDFLALTDAGCTVYTYGRVTSYWELFLYETEENGNRTEMAYKIDDIGKMADNIIDSLNGATLNDLVRMGVLTEDELGADVLEQEIPFADESSKALGDVTIMELLNDISYILSLIS